MLSLLRLTALVAVVSVSLTLVGKMSASVPIPGSLDETAADCRPPAGALAGLTEALAALDYAEAVLIANGEAFLGQDAAAIRAQIAALPRYDDGDGVSAAEAKTLEQLLRYGRQLAYALAEEDLRARLAEAPEGIRVASADDAVTFEVLQKLRAGC